MTMTTVGDSRRQALARRARRQRLLLLEAGADARTLRLFLHHHDADVLRHALVTMNRDDRQAALEVLAAEADLIAEEIGPHALARLVVALTTLTGRRRHDAWTEARRAVHYAQMLSDAREADEVVWDAQGDADEALAELTPYSISTHE